MFDHPFDDGNETLSSLDGDGFFSADLAELLDLSL